MFIRQTPTRSLDGKIYHTYRLVEGVRQGKKVIQKTLLNLGASFDLPREDWPLLAKRIEEILSLQSGFLFESESARVEELAQQLAQRVLLERGEVAPSPDDARAAEANSPEYHEVDIHSMELREPRSVGVEHAALATMERLGLPGILAKAGMSGPLVAAAVGGIVARMAGCHSERRTWDWLCRTSGTGELMQADFPGSSAMQLYRASDQLVTHKTRIEAELFQHIRDMFSLDCVVTLYDLTNTYFEGDAAGCELAARGHSKEKRTDCPLVTLGLVLDASGFVRTSRVFEGNVSEAGSLQTMLEGLQAPADAIVVMDRGIASEENLSWLVGRGMRYLVVSRRQRRVFDEVPAPEVTLQTAAGDDLRVKKELTADGAEVLLFCHSELRAAKERGIVDRFCERFESGLRRLQENLHKPRGEKRMARLNERIGRLKEKSRGVGRHYEIELIPGPDDTCAELQWTKRPVDGTQMTHLGVYCLRSNLLDWDEEKLWRTYIMLTDLESVFRSLKSELGLRPVYHQNQRRTEGHLFITVLAYQVVHAMRTQLKSQDNSASWSTLRTVLGRQMRVTATFARKDGRVLHVRKSTQPEPELKELYHQLNLPPLPGSVVKTLI